MEQNRDNLASLCRFLPRRVVAAVKCCPEEILTSLTEIRLRRGAPLALCAGESIYPLTETGIATVGRGGYIIGAKEMDEAWRLITASSVYALEAEVAKGFITVDGGHRVGIAGKAVMKNAAVKTQKDIFSLNYRLARECPGVAAPLLHYIIKKGRLLNTLIFSPPCAGKTTLLRDVARSLSVGSELCSPQNVVIVDERTEIAAMSEKGPRFDVGPFTDVLTGFPKSEGMRLAVRSLGPQVIIVDELGGDGDRSAVDDGLRSGVALVATAHGDSPGRLKERPVLRGLLADGAFHCLVQLSLRDGPGTVEAIYRREEGRDGFDYVPMAVFPHHRGFTGVDRDDRRAAAEKAAAGN